MRFFMLRLPKQKQFTVNCSFEQYINKLSEITEWLSLGDVFILFFCEFSFDTHCELIVCLCVCTRVCFFKSRRMDNLS